MAQITNLRISGFRAFGTTEQAIDLSPELTIIWAPNSQGKTSIAEALEFFLSGRISRRELLGSAAREFAGSLTNVHMAADEAVQVAATIVDDDGDTHEVVRSLIADYSAVAECASELTIDGSPAGDLSSVGIALSERPLETPILLQHNLRFVLSARPQDRTNFFKAVLEIADLGAFRSLVAEAPERLEQPDSHLLGQLRATLADPRFGSADTVLRGDGDAEAVVEAALVRAFQEVLGAELGDDVPELVAKARIELDRRREAVFPLRALEARGGPPDPPDIGELLEAANKVLAVRSAAEEVGRGYLKLYEAYIELGSSELAERSPTECPLCLTPEAITPERVIEIRRSLTDTAEYRSATGDFSRLCGDCLDDVRSIRTRLLQAIPEVVTWDQEARTSKGLDKEALGRLLPEAATELIDSWDLAVEDVTTLVDAVVEKAKSLEEALGRLKSTAFTQGDVEVASHSLSDLGESIKKLQAASGILSDLGRRLRELVVPLLDQMDNLRPLRKLVELAPDLSKVAGQLEAARTVARIHDDCAHALREIDQAIAEVLDEKFDDLASEISRWWRLMRAEEPSFFAGVQRVGSGRRYIDLKAGLSTGRVNHSAAEERDAVAVFSDSQLNCLGLSAFLARVSRSPVGFVVLDDPIQGSDTEHRATFIEHVPETLISDGQQVIVLTHDERLSASLQDRYAHRDLSVYRVLAVDPGDGAKVNRTRDTIDELLARVEPLKHQEEIFFRQLAASLLRNAAERFCKLLIVKRARDRGEVTTIADHDGKTLGVLIPAAEPLLDVDPAHPGKLRMVENITNPGNHDDAAPPSADIRHALGEMKRFCQDYLR